MKLQYVTHTHTEICIPSIYIYKIYTHTHNHGNPHNPQTVSLLLAHPEVHSSYSWPLSKALKEPRRNITRPAAQLSWKPCSADLRYLRSQMDAATALGHGGMGWLTIDHSPIPEGTRKSMANLATWSNSFGQGALLLRPWSLLNGHPTFGCSQGTVHRVLSTGVPWCTLVYLEGLRIPQPWERQEAVGWKNHPSIAPGFRWAVSQMSPCTLNQCNAQAVSAEKDFHKAPVVFESLNISSHFKTFWVSIQCKKYHPMYHAMYQPCFLRIPSFLGWIGSGAEEIQHLGRAAGALLRSGISMFFFSDKLIGILIWIWMG